MAKRSKKLKAREQREEEIRLKEEQDAAGIKRRAGSGYNEGISIKALSIIKIILLIGMPAAYFLYSVLLLPIMLLYGLTYFITKKQEKRLNYGMRKDLWIKLPKFDSFLALIVIVVVIAVTGLSAVTTSSNSSLFAGKSTAQLYAIFKQQGLSDTQALERAERLADSSMTQTTTQRLLTQTLTLMTGERVLFEEQGGMQMGGTMVFRSSGGTPPSGEFSGGTPPSGGKMIIRNGGSTGSFMKNLPLSATITSVFSTISIVLIVVVFIGGIFVVIMTSRKKSL